MLPITKVVNPVDASYNDSSTDYLFIFENSDSIKSEDGRLLDSIDEYEKEEYNYVKKLKTYDDAGNMFAPTELNNLREKELALMERNRRVYYRSNIEYT